MAPDQPAEGPSQDPPPFPPVFAAPCHRASDGIVVLNPATGSVEIATKDHVLVTDSGPGIVIGAGDDATECSARADDTTDNSPVEHSSDGKRAYWLRHTLREATYGRVRYAVALRRRRPPGATATEGGASAQWETTDVKCAVKEMSWKQIRHWKGRMAEDPIKEVCALHYLKEYYRQQKCGKNASVDTGSAAVDEMSVRHTILPLDLLSDDQYLYSIMPYCNSELFDLLGERDNFTECECRHVMRQILTGLENLHQAGITHRDLRPENLLLHQDGNSLVIIDLGKCLCIPRGEGDKRYLISPQGTCGMLSYEPPEIASDITFDGHSVDLFAVGVILFLMLTGFPPWERPHQSDERFKYMSAGYLTQMLTEWELDLSPEAMDLLQGMLWFDPKDRLRLQQVRNHAWMTISD